MRIYGSLNLNPPVLDTLGMILTVKFTSDKCKNAYIISFPIMNVIYDISDGTETFITLIDWG